MKRLSAWIALEKRRIAKLPRLEDALLGRRALAYIAHRLRFVTLRVVLRTALHIVEVVALSRVFSSRYLGPILFMRHSTLLLSSLYWGALEAQRIALRDARKRHDAGGFASISSRWSAVALLAIVLQQLLVAGYLAFGPRRFEGFSIYDAYAIACGLRLGLDTWSRTQQSAVFAISRVRRPLASMIFIDILELFGLLVAWLQLGAFAFALMLVVTGCLRAATTLWYCRVTRNQLRLPVATRSPIREILRGDLRNLPWRVALKFALLNASLQIDSLVIVLLSTGAAGADGLRLSLIMHAMAPLLGAGFSWTRVFYFDFVRLGAYLCPMLAQRFGRLLDWVALLYPIVLVGLVFPVVWWLVPEILTMTPSLLGGFVVARSLFALRQMEAYSYADHRAQLRQAVILAAMTGLLLTFVHRLDLLITGATLALLLGATLSPRARIVRAAPEPGASLCLEQFVGWLATQAGGLHIVVIDFDRRLTSAGKLRLALLGHGFTGPNLQPTPHQLLIVVSEPTNLRALRYRLVSATAGTANAIVIGGLANDGIAACAQLRTEPWRMGLPVEENESSGSVVPMVPTIETLASEFQQLFPDGLRLSRSKGSIKRLGAPARGELREILAAIHQNRPRMARRTHCLEIAVYRPLGETTQLFLLPSQSARLEAFAAFRNRVTRASELASFAAFAGLGVARAEP